MDWGSFTQRIRDFFKGRGYKEVCTPLLLKYPNLDPNVEVIEVKVKREGREERRFLQTSPEIYMKKILAKEKKSIFQITKAFRNNEFSKIHNIEFNILEFYKVNCDYDCIINEALDFFSLFFKVKFKVLNLEDAFSEFLGITFEEDEEILKNNLISYGYPFEESWSWEELFSYLYLELLKKLEGFYLLKDFPPGTSPLCREEGGRVKRFEVIIRGVEVANCCVEERDGELVRKNLEPLAERSNLPLDEEFLKSLGEIPPCGGCSVGLDRLFMLIGGEDRIREFYL